MSFGIAPTTSSTGFTFSTPVTVTTASTGTAPSFSFGIGAGTGGTGGTGGVTSLNFGTTTSSSTAAPSFNFGSTPSQTPALNPGGTSTGAPTVGVAVTATPIATATTATASTLTGASTLGSTGGTNFSFGSLASAPSTQPSASAAPIFSFGVGGSLNKTTAPTLTLGTVTTCSAPTTTTPAPIGLGGVSMAAAQQTSEQKTNLVAVKENKVPQEILKTVDDFKPFIKEQKMISSEIARTSMAKMSTVTNEIESLKRCLQEIADKTENNYQLIISLRNETSKAIQNAEMVKQVAETPQNLQFENTAPLKYFQDLVDEYENDLEILRRQIEMTKSRMKSLTMPQSVTVDDMNIILKQFHESFVALAGRIQDSHRKVESVKKDYLNLRNRMLNEKEDIFADIDGGDEGANISKISSGPSPFSALASINLGKYISNDLRGSGLQSTLSSQMGGGIGNFSSTNPPLFGLTEQSSSTGLPTFGSGTMSGIGGISTGGFGSALNLQKPPAGSKRNKQS